MSNQSKTPPRPPLEQDAERVVAAIRRLIEVGCAEDAAVIERMGCWPAELRPGTSPLTQAIVHPVRYAQEPVMKCLVSHLATLLGQDEAQAAVQAILDEQRETPAVRASVAVLEAVESRGRAAAIAATPSSPSRSVH